MVGVSSRRTLILIAAVVIGAVAAFALFTYVGGIEDDAYDNAERVGVFKIVQDIPKGTFGDDAVAQGLIEEDEIPREFRPASAINSLAEIEGLVAVIDLPANQPVLNNHFVPQAESLSSFSSLLRNNEVAITVSVDQVRGVAGLLVPGDFVNMLVVVQEAGAEQQAQEGAAANPAQEVLVYESPARYLYQKVQILAVGQTRKLEPGETAVTNPDGTPTSATSSGLVTFAVPADAAQRIASVSGGGIYLTLVPKDYQPEPLGPLDITEGLPGEQPTQLTPYGPEGKAES